MGYRLSICIKDIIECLYLMIWPFFRFLGRNLSNFFFGILENLRHQKDILKLTDLYSVHEDIDNVSDKLEACILSLKNLSYKMINASQLKSLSLQCCKSSEGIFEELLASCQSLEKLSLKFVDINTNVIKRFSHKNGQTLQVWPHLFYLLPIY